MVAAARRSATVPDRRILRVLDVDERDGLCWVVNEWGSGTSLDILVANAGVTRDGLLVQLSDEAWNQVLAVPECSQMVYPDGGQVWCSPTSTSMVPRGLGTTPSTSTSGAEAPAVMPIR